MQLFDAMMKIERRIERLAERSDVTLQPIELRRRILDDVEGLVEPSGRGRRVLPFNWVGVRFPIADPRRRAAVEAVFEDAGGLQSAVEARLSEAGCPVPAGFVVEIAFVEGDDNSAAGRPYVLVCERRVPAPRTSASARRESAVDRPPTAGVDDSVPAAAAGRLVVLKGDAVEPIVEVGSVRLNIGRLAEVLDRDHRVVRRNHLVFTDTDSAVNQTVSRAQAHIEAVPAGELRLFDDHSSYGTRVFRDGRTIELPAGSPKGVRLQPGDEIYFGRACVRFERP